MNATEAGHAIFRSVSRDDNSMLSGFFITVRSGLTIILQPRFVYYGMNISDAILLMRGVCNRKHYSLSTEKTYTHWLGRFGLFLKAHKPAATTPEQKMEAFLTQLAAQGSAAATQNQAFNSLLFFYREVLKHELGSVQALRAKASVTFRECPTTEEVTRLLAAVRDVHGYPARLLVHILYACGLRVTEPFNLRIKDLDLANSRFNIRQAKGKKDRVVGFPGCLAAPLAQQLELARAMAAADRARGIPVPLPGLLDRKYPAAGQSERWAWLFPSLTTCHHPRTRKEVRWRCHEANVQKAVRYAARQCGLEGVTPHNLRHAYATHALQNGAFVRDLQVVLGHNSLETTMRYLHAEASRVASPLRNFAPVPSAA